jgi:hypothetical protein
VELTGKPFISASCRKRSHACDLGDGGIGRGYHSTFVLISQNRMIAAADKHADLDLQINLAEHEASKPVAKSVAAAKARSRFSPFADT